MRRRRHDGGRCCAEPGRPADRVDHHPGIGPAIRTSAPGGKLPGPAGPGHTNEHDGILRKLAPRVARHRASRGAARAHPARPHGHRHHRRGDDGLARTRGPRRRHPGQPFLLALPPLRDGPADRRHPGLRPASGRPPLPHDPADPAPRRVARGDPGPALRRRGVARRDDPGRAGPGPAGLRRRPVLPAPHGLGPAARPVAGGAVRIPGRPCPTARHPGRDPPGHRPQRARGLCAHVRQLRLPEAGAGRRRHRQRAGQHLHVPRPVRVRAGRPPPAPLPAARLPVAGGVVPAARDRAGSAFPSRSPSSPRWACSSRPPC